MISPTGATSSSGFTLGGLANPMSISFASSHFIFLAVVYGNSIVSLSGFEGSSILFSLSIVDFLSDLVILSSVDTNRT